MSDRVSRSSSAASRSSPGSSGSRSRSASRSASRSRSGSPRSASSRGSAMSEDEAPTERKDVEDSGSEPEDGGASAAAEGGEKRGSPAAAAAEEEPKSSHSPPATRASASEGSDAEPSVEKARSRQSSGGDDKMSVDDDVPREGIGAEDIFGDNLSISSDDSDGSEAKKKAKKSRAAEQSDDSDREVQRYDDDNKVDDEEEAEQVEPKRYDDDEEAAAAKEDGQEEGGEVPETRIDVEVPKITTDLGKELYFVKLPNFLSVECRPFDAEQYEDEIEDEDSLDEEGRQRLKLKVENTIRWRQEFDAEGKAVKQSNARVVRWSDGSMSLYLGNEIFDVHKQSLHGDFNHMFIRQGTGLQGQAIFRTKLSFRPHSTESKTHQKMTRQMADRTHKATGIKVISQVGRDPEANRYKRVKEEEERLRADLRRDSKASRVRERAPGRGLSRGYLEGGDSDENEVSLSAIKNKYKKGRRGFQRTYSSEEDDSDVETKKAKRLEKAKSAIGESDDEESNASRKSSRASSRSNSPKAGGSRSQSRSRSSSRSKSPRSRASGSESN